MFSPFALAGRGYWSNWSNRMSGLLFYYGEKEIRMGSSRLFVILGWVAAVLMIGVWGAPQAHAQGNIRLGRIEVKPSLSYKVEYNDNVFFTQRNEQDDVIHTITPSVTFMYEGNKDSEGNVLNFFRAGYLVDIAMYSDWTDNNFENHQPFAQFQYKSPMGFYLKANDSYMNTADPYGDTNQYNTGVAQSKRYTNRASLAAGYEFFRRFGIEAQYANKILRYDAARDLWQDKTDNIYGGRLFYRVSPKTLTFVMYRFTDTEYDSQNDGVRDTNRNANWRSDRSQDHELSDFFIGAEFEPGGKLSGEVKLGYGSKDWKNSRDISGNVLNDHDTWLAETSVTYQPTERTAVTLMLQRSQLGSTDTDTATYDDTLVGLSLRQELINRFTLIAGIQWNRNDYQDEPVGRPEKRYDIYTYDLGLDYNANRWLTLGVNYRYKEKDASDAAYETGEYEVNGISAKATAAF